MNIDISDNGVSNWIKKEYLPLYYLLFKYLLPMTLSADDSTPRIHKY